MTDIINSPPHYKAGAIEAIDVIEAFELEYHLGNVVKYILRAGRKESEDRLTSLRKAQWYLNREIARCTPSMPVNASSTTSPPFASPTKNTPPSPTLRSDGTFLSASKSAPTSNGA